MAILKTITDPYTGIPYSYHRIQRLECLYGTADPVIVNVHLAQYTSEGYRQQEKADGQNLTRSLRSDLVHFELPTAEAEGLTREAIYTRIMALPDWEGSERV